jgi:hypothetical protein
VFGVGFERVCTKCKRVATLEINVENEAAAAAAAYYERLDKPETTRALPTGYTSLRTPQVNNKQPPATSTNSLTPRHDTTGGWHPWPQAPPSPLHAAKIERCLTTRV